jgi:dTDP-4-dehydrorhamnose 3,5-epimerase
MVLIEPKVVGDDRGFFCEIYHAERYAQAGVPSEFVQDNYSRSIKNTLRGLHFQQPHAQGKLVQVFQGAVFDVAVDIRRGSPTFGKWFGTELSAENKRQLWIPPGFAHGFCVVSEMADFFYKCTDFYFADAERCIAWNDPELGIQWPIMQPILSKKDSSAPRLSESKTLPRYSK